MPKKSVTDVGSQMPQNLKFGIIVAVALFWAEFLRSVLKELLSPWTGTSEIMTNLLLASAASVAAYLALFFYRKLLWKLKKIKL